jgi:hypothetical protein
MREQASCAFLLSSNEWKIETGGPSLGLLIALSSAFDKRRFIEGTIRSS